MTALELKPFMDDGSATLYQGDCLDVLRRLPSESVHCCVTSPPYFGLRDYGTAEWQGGDVECDHKAAFRPRDERPNPSGSNIGKSSEYNDKQDSGKLAYRDACDKCGAVRIDAQIGLEATPAEFVAKMVEVFTEVHRVLRKDGTLWLNLGDSYAGGKGQSGSGGAEKQEQRAALGESFNRGHQTLGGSKQTRPTDDIAALRSAGLKPKDLMGMPWRVAFALQEAGWWLRQDIIWSKPNPMPESVTDRCTKAHEYIFLLSKSAKYFYDAEAIKEPMAGASVERLPQDTAAQSGSVRVPGKTNGPMKAVGGRTGANAFRGQGHFRENETGPANRDGRDMKEIGAGNTRNKRSVWTVTTQPYSEAHFATFPPKLIEPCVLAGCPSDGVVLDPFAGAGTTLLVAKRLGRKSVGIELNPEYCKLIERRLEHWHKPSPPKAVDDSFVGTLFEGIDQEVAA